jgi:hypothetical protein
MVKIIKVFNSIYSKYLGVHIFKCIEIIKFKMPDIFNSIFRVFKNIADGSFCPISLFSFGYKRKDNSLFCLAMLWQIMNYSNSFLFID